MKLADKAVRASRYCMKNLLKIETLSPVDMEKILADTVKIKKERGHHKTQIGRASCRERV